MRRMLLTTSLLLATQLYANTTTQNEGMHAIKLLGKTLKSHLKSKLQQDSNGSAAMEFCTLEAQSLTQQVNAALPKNVKVRRTALKVRNAANQPDTTDIKIMKQYENAAKKKYPSAKLITRVKVGETTRYYKPLLMQPVCLKCHGSDLSPAINTALHASYPDDKAVGMKLGEFRGVIVSEVTAQE